MKYVRMAVTSAVAAAILSVAVPVLPASSADAFRFSFDAGNVRLGYTDGYWDNGHKWHKWRNGREAREFQNQYHDRYVADRHTRFKNAGWRDSDGDGVPDRLDSRPNNPRRN
jgi:hypothetical protein